MLKDISGDTVELSVTIKPTRAKEYGVSVFCDKDNIDISLFSKGGDITAKVKCWKMKSIYAGQ